MKGETPQTAVSLARRLLAILAFAMLVALAVTLYSVLRQVDRETEQVLDARLLKTAENLLHQSVHLIRDDHRNEAWLSLETTRGMENAWLGEFSHDGSMLSLGKREKPEADQAIKSYIWLVSEDGAIQLGDPMPGYVRTKGAGRIQTLQRDGHEWRVASVLDDSGEYWVFVAQRDDVRSYLANRVGGRLLLLQLLLIPVVVLVLWFGIRRGLKPLARLSGQIAGRRGDDLRAVSMKEVPPEIQPVVASINVLLERLRLTLESERSFTADAAHELRGPLTVVRNLSRILADAHSLEEVHRSANLLDQSVERMAQLLSQLLHLARLDNLDHAGRERQVPLRQLLEQSVTEVMPAAAARNMRLSYQAKMEVDIRGDAAMLALAMKNLLANAVKYGRNNGNVEIRLQHRNKELLLEVMDNGSGVHPRHLNQLFERFYRTPEAKRANSGTGLGLSIVKRVAELHDFEITASNREEGGLCVSLLIPPSRWMMAEESRPVSQAPEEKVIYEPLHNG